MRLSLLLCTMLLLAGLLRAADVPEEFPKQVSVGGVTLFTTGEGALRRVTVAGRSGYTTSGRDILYGDVAGAKSAHLRLEIDLHDNGFKGSIYVPYDSADDTVLAEARYPGAWKSSTLTLAGVNAWTTVTLEWPDARLAHRCNGHDFRMHIPHASGIVIGAIRVVELPPVAPPTRPVRMPLTATTLTNVVRGGDVLRLPGRFTQGDESRIVMNAADATVLQMQTDKSLGAEGKPGGGRYIHFVEQAQYRFTVKTAGVYQLWERAWFPVKGSWNHHEDVDNKQMFNVIDSPNTLEANRWHWIKAGRYTLAAGEHTLHLSYHGGARLDRLAFLPEGVEPAGDGGTPSRNVAPATGVVETADAVPMDVAAWLALDSEQDARGGSLRVELSADGGVTWFPAPADGALADLHARGGGKDRLRARLTLTAAPDGASPIVQGLAARYQPGAYDQVTLAGDALEIAFGPVGVRKLRAKALDVDFLFGGQEAPLFQLLVKPRGNAAPSWLASTGAAVLSREVKGNALVQRFAFPNGILVTCTVTLTGADSRWGIDIDNRSPQEVAAVQYPLLRGVRVGADAGDDALIIPSFWRQLVRNPVAWNAQPVRELAMHWTYLYDAKAGLYLGDHNWPMRDLTIIPVRNDPTTLSYGFTREYLTAPGARRDCPDIVVAVRPGGDWHPGADIYRAWAKDFIQPPATPAWTQRMDGWCTGPSDVYPYAGYAAIAPVQDRAMQRGLGYYMGGNRAQIDGPIEYVGMWPTYCPAYGTLQEFKDALRELREQGGHSNWYFNWQLLSPARVVGRSRIAGVVPRAWVEHPVTWATKDWYQKTALRWYTWGEAQLGTDEDELVQCVGSTTWQQHHEERTADWVKLYGADGMYYDQLSCVNNLCGSLEHGHNDYGVWGWSTAEDLKRITTKLRQVNPHFVSSGEGCNDLIGQTVTFHMTSGVWNRLELFRYCLPEQILLDGGWNGGAWQGDDRWRYIWMTGTRFEGLPDTPYCNGLLDLRRRVSQLLYPARFMDTVGLRLEYGGQVQQNPPASLADGMQMAPLTGAQAKWYLLAAPSKGALINVIQDKQPAIAQDEILPLTVSIPTAAIGPVKVAWALYPDGRTARLAGTAQGGRYRVELPQGVNACTVLLVNQVGPQVTTLDLPFAAAPGSTAAGTATFTHFGAAPATVNLRWQGPAGWTGNTAAVTLNPGETKSAPVRVTVPATAVANRYDLTLVTEAEGAVGLYPHWITATSALWVRLLRNADHTMTATIFNRSDKALAGTLTLTPPKGITVDKLAQPFSVNPWGKTELPVTLKGLEPLQAPVHLQATAVAGKATARRALMLNVPTPNGHFEIDSAGDGRPDWWVAWGTGDSRDVADHLALDPKEPYFGQYSLRIDPEPTAGKFVRATPIAFRLDAGKQYRVRVAVRTTAAEDQPYVEIGGKRLTAPAVPGKWHVLEGICGNSGSLNLVNPSRHPVWFDALTVEVVP